MDETFGIYPAIVKKVDDPEHRGRVKVICPDVFGDTATKSEWCEPCVPVAFDNGGDFCLPKKNEGVWVLFIDGDTSRPVYLGGWWSDDKSPVESYDEAQEQRIINFENNTILLKKDYCKVISKDVEIEIDGGKIKIKGDVEITGDVKIVGALETTKEAKLKNINYSTHTHTGAHGETSAPNGH